MSYDKHTFFSTFFIDGKQLCMSAFARKMRRLELLIAYGDAATRNNKSSKGCRAELTQVMKEIPLPRLEMPDAILVEWEQRVMARCSHPEWIVDHVLVTPINARGQIDSVVEQAAAHADVHGYSPAG